MINWEHERLFCWTYDPDTDTTISERDKLKQDKKGGIIMYESKYKMDEIPDELRKVAVAWGDAYNWAIWSKVKLASDIMEALEKMKLKSDGSDREMEEFAEWIGKERYTRLNDGLFYRNGQPYKIHDLAIKFRQSKTDKPNPQP